MKHSRFLVATILAFSLVLVTHAQTIDELKDKISDRSTSIKQLEDEIKQYQSQIDDLGKKADSLKNTLAELDLSKKKLETSLKVTQAKIDTTTDEIKQLSTEIDDKSERISDSRRVIAQSLSSIAQTDNSSLIETLLGSQSLASAWDGAEQLVSLQSSVNTRIHELRNIKASLEDNKKSTEQKKTELVSLQNDLSNQKKALLATVQAQNSILAETKNTESSYKSIVAQKEAQKAIFEKELFQYESALKVAIDKSLIPESQHGILAWPLDHIVITQYFGKTVDAKRLYVSGTHGGMDLAASIGTPVMAAMGGIITDTEAVKTKSGCQYGKFVLIKHPNGLSTLYGHLSLVNVSPGESVSTGQVIGYSGNTGYATGPHLHFGVYATQGVRVVNASALGSVSCAGIKTVAAPLDAYLDPLLYL
jgi:murein DD-endopeptidase MepM/ murein hydrolase activator NlpD